MRAGYETITVKRKHFYISNETSEDRIEHEPKENQTEQNEKMDDIVRSNTDLQERQDTEKLTQVNVSETDDPENSNSTEKNENAIKQAIENNEEKKYKCRFCKETFSEKSAVQKHIAVMHFEDIAIVESKSEPFQNITQELKVIEVKDTDQINIEGKRNDSKVEELNDKYCQKCHKHFYDKRNLKDHTDAVHLKIKKYKCDECSRSFGQFNTLKSHIECVHKKLRKFKCIQCTKSFSQQSSLKSHVECTHENLKKFKCDKCPKSYGHRKGLKKHIDRRLCSLQMQEVQM